MKDTPRLVRIEIQAPAQVTDYYRKALRSAALAAVRELPPRIWKAVAVTPGAELHICVVSPVKMQQLNRQFRGKDRPTDVLAFPPTPSVASPWLGDVVLCWKVAADQAQHAGCTLREEAQRLTVHGVLHLFGYDHETGPTDARRMFRLQNRIVRLLSDSFNGVQPRRTGRRIKGR